MEKQKKGLSYYIFFAIGYGVARFYKYKLVSGILTAIVVGFLVFALAFNPDEALELILVTIFLALCFFFIVGIIFRVVDLPFNLAVDKYEKLFEDIDLKTVNGELPRYITEDETDYLQVLAFDSKIPVKEWLKKKSYIETFLNARIASIYNHEENNNIVYVSVIKNDLPTTLDWDDDMPYSFNDKDTLSMGMSYEGIVGIDLNKNAHAFIAGETGSGKSNIMKGLIYRSICYHAVILIDFKRGVSFSTFANYIKIYSDHEETREILTRLVEEMNDRYDTFRKYKVEDITAFNNLSDRQYNRIVVFIDELAELIKTGDKEMTASIMGSLESLTRLSRAAGINLIMGIQRPDSTIITGQIKNNVAFRVCGRFVDPEPSRIMLGNDMATSIPNIKGRFILKDDDFTEFQAFRFTDEIIDIDSLLGSPPEVQEEQERLEREERIKEQESIQGELQGALVRLQEGYVEHENTEDIYFDFQNISLEESEEIEFIFEGIEL